MGDTENNHMQNCIQWVDGLDRNIPVITVLP